MGPRRKLGRKKPSRSSNLSDPSTRLSTSTTGSATPRLSRGSNPVDDESTRSDSEEKSTKTATTRTPTSYEFQAPQFHDFMRATPAGGTVDEWFDARQGTPEDAGDESFRDSANFSECDDSFTAKRITMIYTGNRNDDHVLFPETEVPEPEKEAEPEEIKDRNFERLLVNEEEGLEHLEPATSRSSLQSTGLRDVSEKRSSFGAAFQERPKFQDRRSYTRTSFVRPMATRATATLSSFISSSTLPASTSSTDAKRKTKKTTLEKKSEVTTVQPTQRSVKLTVPQEFHFATDQLHPMSRRSQVALGTLGMLKKRSTGGITKKGYKKKHPLDLTVPKPFRFQSSARSIVAAKAALGLADGSDSGKSPYVPLALKLRSFQDKTPERFKVRPMSKAIDRLREQTRKLTQPKSPQLLTKSRLKPSTLLPTEERLAQETAITANLFKAKPINPKIFESQGDLGVPKIPKSELTVPMSPAITKGRNSRFVATESPPTPPRIRANPILHNLNQPFRPVIEHRKVVPEPFHLPGESLHASRQREKEYLLEKLREQEDKSRMFKARPLPSFDEAPLRSRGIEPKEPVIPKPFNFQTDKRGEQYQERLRAQQDLEERRRNKENQFHAQPLPKDGPFIPKRSTKPLTTAEDVILHSDLRAEGRRHFDEERKEREKLEEELRELRKLESEHQEKEEIRILRERLVHHANPVRHFASVQVVPSNKGLTLPQSPAIGKKRNMTEPTHAIRTRRRKSASYDRKNDDVLLRNLGDDTQHPDVALDAYFRQNDNYSHEREAEHIEEDGMDKYFLGEDQGDVVA